MTADSTTTIAIELDRLPTIKDIQRALDTMRAEGIPDTFEVDVVSTTVREDVKDVPYSERPERPLFRMTASRAAKVPSALDGPARTGVGA